MLRINERQALFYTILTLIVTILIGYLFQGRFILVGGLLIGIFLTAFIPGKRSTILFSVISAVVIILFEIVYEKELISVTSIIQTLLRLLVIFITSIIVIHLKNLYANIRSDKTHMTSLFENATEGIILTDSIGKIILVNPAAERMFGYNAIELFGNTVEVLLPGQFKHKHVGLREGFYKAPSNRAMGTGRDLYAKRKDNSEFPVEVSLSHYQERNDMYVIAFIVDITHRKEAERNLIQQKKELERVTEQIRRLNAELEGKVEERTVILKEALQKLEESQKELSEALDKERELNEIKSRFVSMASHEFRTPLSTVLSSASLLAKYTTTEDQEKRNRHIEKIKGSVKHLNDILEDFLSLGKLDEGKVESHLVAFDLKEFIDETVDEMKGLLKNDQLVLVEHTGETNVHTDKKLLKNIIINLLGNAIKFSDDGATIDMKSKVEGSEATITIADKGIGISKEDQEHLFTSFFRAKNVTNIQGTGLGLHIVKRYIDLLNGTVTLQSQLNKGTTVTFTIPINQRHE
ncbi:MAG TPA: ATP-binding protein [Chitinophagaceae bacterium]|nr:ATP-binding protein [Chitinophagaceae bacterium]